LLDPESREHTILSPEESVNWPDSMPLPMLEVAMEVVLPRWQGGAALAAELGVNRRLL